MAQKLQMVAETVALRFPIRITVVAFLSGASLLLWWKSRLLRRRRLRAFAALSYNNSLERSNPRGKLLFASHTGTSKTLAQRLFTQLSSNNIPFDLLNARDYEPEELCNESLLLIVASTWDDGEPPPDAVFLARWLSESTDDFRIGSLLLSRCKFAIFGIGSRSYGPRFNAVARDFSRQMRALGASEILPLCQGDIDRGDLDEVFEQWSTKIVSGLLEGEISGENCKSVGSSLVGTVKTVSDGYVDSEEGYSSEDNNDGVENSESYIGDLEDIAGKAPSRRSFGTSSNVLDDPASSATTAEHGQRAMVTPVIRANLEKQGYKIIGSHSGVKLCRWTKSQLRGRGGCYKHSFYGIESHRCMEATPSLACANKCVFCWRHHSNPVGKTWKWKMDDPLEIVDTAIDLHTKMIKQMKGVPGVKEDKLTEGLAPRHCALSLVGEPIMYPQINSLVDELHRKRISTFLVTNAQFPERIRMLRPVTQLYVSVDAATKDNLKQIDRPLFSDFWERFIDSLKALQEKDQRTVYRLTLVKGWNAEDIDAYAKLLAVGRPDFIEIKGVTYCGSSSTSKLTMENVPWHSDVKSFSEALALKSNSEYAVACEHVHSCCVLLGKVEKFKVDGEWFTWIDYEKFHDLVASGKPFDSKDYMAKTPLWAVYGAEEGGFDPFQTRYKKERHHRRVPREVASMPSNNK
ncbi:hypothetical protein H6P81_018539 [Aristolochia fimbriata]|uniref:tRNA 4-demethylwyosine synthase (AdoMet-dependent) n=1 Tax=Aristolochia fimbriata TaxID=158543 RepID=A0AAV7E1C5_ARIFI|nr:hypothetical protein H6P81_018539 [Aristolochia fimbriata]